MNLPPAITTVRVADPGTKGFRLWLPVFLLWPLLLIVGALLLVVAVVADAVLLISGNRYHRCTWLVLGVMAAVSESRGLSVQVDGPKKSVFIELK